jgi:transcriptional regulator of acetoin/glycerol metabolism
MATGLRVRTLCSDHLDPLAGQPIGPRSDRSAAAGASTAKHPEDEIARALAEARGNVSSAARRLGVHRNKVRRWLDRYRVDPEYFKAPVKSRSS